ncbi:hypothetical protein GALMADRAFT_229580 [Galerina marginata CBS 339.88]|uniref:NAD-P-binding protein n=1 Tax=Galerina marginata (strain CBS 339.88) TaxID=685588 RepID=A0A067SL38_GALM3|nr:hypothetical protein GALMADRAFT_229580 [Galerina marginata CBS 339.88]
MASQTTKSVLVVAGLGNGSGTGAATARLFAKKGYSVALIARGAEVVDKLADEINNSGGHGAPFSVPSYSDEDVTAAWSAIHAKFPKPEYIIRVALFNAGHGVWKNFLDVTPQDVQDVLQISVAAAFSFSRGAILAFKDNDIEQANGKKGALIFTGATASLRGNVMTSAFAAGKFGLRALSQSLAKEFGKENIHVSHAIIDGVILVDRQRDRRGSEWAANEDGRLSADSIANSYLYLVNQDRSAWTWELDLRPAHEKW